VVEIVRTVGVIVAALVSAYAVFATETARGIGARRASIERLLAAVLALTEAAIVIGERSGGGAEFKVAQMRLRAELQPVGVKRFEATDVMARPNSASKIAAQGEPAVLEIGQRLDELTPRPLWSRLIQARPARAVQTSAQTSGGENRPFAG